MSLYLKYRPKDFNSLTGQDFIKETLQKAVVQDKIVGAYLFCGPRGTGKTSTARILAKAINCKNNKNGNPCNNCEICNAINNENLVDIIEIDAASHTGVDNIREIIEKAQFSPSHTKYKVYIIDEVHMLSKGAFNALLKILEEPPKFVKFILATTETHKVPETIISRCQRYDFRKINNKDIKKRLTFIAKQENIKIDEKSLDYIAKNSGGGLRNAISLFEQLVIDNQINYEHILNTLSIINEEKLEIFFNKLLKKDNSIIKDLEEISSSGKNLKLFLKELIFFIKDKTIENLKNQKNIEKQINILDILDETYRKMKNSLDEEITLIIGILKIINSINNEEIINNKIKIQKIENKKIIEDKCIYSNIQKGEIKNNNLKQEKTEELKPEDIGDIFGEIENNSNEKIEKTQENNNFDKQFFLNKLKDAGVKGLIISSLKQSEINLTGNKLTIKFKTNFVKNQFNKEENLVSVQNILQDLGFENIKINLI